MNVRGGIDLGGTKIQAVVVDTKNAVLGDARRPTPRDGGPEAVAAEMVETLSEATKSAEVALDQLGGVGVGSPARSTRKPERSRTRATSRCGKSPSRWPTSSHA
jgi:predicted NBD/HSP70 family sugar kinase